MRNNGNESLLLYFCFVGCVWRINLINPNGTCMISMAFTRSCQGLFPTGFILFMIVIFAYNCVIRIFVIEDSMAC